MRSEEARARPGAGRRFYRAHGLGNDYLVFEEGSHWWLTPGAIEAVCHRWEGVGGDGIVILLAGEAPPFRARMFNPDGSEFERSGNGLRILASYLHRTGRVGHGNFALEVGGERVLMRVHSAEAGLYDVSVEMGVARTGPETVELEPGHADEGLGLLHFDGIGTFSAVPVSVGNPHCVVFGDPEPYLELKRGALEDVGRALAGHPAFRAGVNVQLARVRNPDTLEALVWERGVGHTAASGTSACAVAVAAVVSGRCAAGPKRVVMEGGSLHVHVSDSLDVELRGPVRAVSDAELDEGFPADRPGETPLRPHP